MSSNGGRDSRRPILLAWSGGKDSTLALAALRADPTVQMVGLVTAVTTGYDRISIHGVRRSILEAQSRALALPVFEAELAPQSPNEAYEASWATALERARAVVGHVSGLAFGDLFLADVRAYREALGTRIGYEALFPLWGRDTATLAASFVADGYEAYLTCVDTTQLSGEFAGRRFDGALLRDLPTDVDRCGERGEFHTCVVNGPVFGERIRVTLGEQVLRDERFAYCDLMLA